MLAVSVLAAWAAIVVTFAALVVYWRLCELTFDLIASRYVALDDADIQPVAEAPGPLEIGERSSDSS